MKHLTLMTSLCLLGPTLLVGGSAPLAASTNGAAGKVTVCHATGSPSNPYLVLSVSQQAWQNGHSHHPGDSLMTTWYGDFDGDGYGDDSNTLEACEQPDGYSEVDGDCDDADEDANPGASEVCDGSDNDCDGTVDNDTDGLLITARNSDVYEVDLGVLSTSLLLDTSWGLTAYSLAGRTDTSVVYGARFGGDVYWADLDAGTSGFESNGGSGVSCGLTYGTDTDTLFALDHRNNRLRTYDIPSGTWSNVSSSIGYDVQNCGLTYREDDGYLYAMHASPGTGTGRVHKIDPDTGVQVDSVTLPSGYHWQGAAIAYSCENKTFLLYRPESYSGLFEVDVDFATGIATIENTYDTPVDTSLSWTKP